MAKTKKLSTASSQPGKLARKSEADIRAWSKTPEAKAQAARLKASGADPSAASLKEIPELTDEELASCYPARKVPVTTRLDGDILAWLKGKPGKYQQHLNAELRQAMLRERKARPIAAAAG